MLKNRAFVILVAAALVVAFVLASAVAGYFRTDTIYVASRDLEAMTVLESNMLRPALVHPNMMGGVYQNAITDPDAVIGSVLTVPISSGHPIFLQQLADPRDAYRFVGREPSAHERFVTVPADTIGTLGGQIEPGMHLDIWAIYRTPDRLSNQISVLVEKALVVDVHFDGDVLEALTFALPTRDAMKVALAGSEGRLYYALPGSNADSVPSGTTIYIESLFEGDMGSGVNFGTPESPIVEGENASGD